jgi:hypothetical protein
LKAPEHYLREAALLSSSINELSMAQGLLNRESNVKNSYYSSEKSPYVAKVRGLKT